MIKKLLGIAFFMLLAHTSFAINDSELVVASSNLDIPKSEQLDPVYKDFRMAVGGGYAFRLGSREKFNDSKLDQIMKDLMHGYNIDADAQYFFNESWGVGLNFNYVKTSAKANDIRIPNFGSIDSYKENQTFLYFGPSVAARYEFSSFLVICSMGVGPLFYGDDTNILPKGTKTTVAVNGGVGLEYKLNQNFGTGLKLSYTSGTIGSINYGDGMKVDFDKRQSISNLLITAFISFRTWK